MKKVRRLNKKIILVILLLFTIAILPFITYQFKSGKELDIVIIDKTVPSKTYREHKGFVWIANNLKYTNKGKAYKYDQDYYGFFPDENEKYTIKELPEELGTPDIIYLTDTYGVYTEDYLKEIPNGERSQIIYGGLKSSEVDTIKKSLQNNIIIGEFNTLASPTSKEVRSSMEEVFGIKWSGWIGRYFTDLSKDNVEIPPWLIENYQIQYLKKWDFKGPGIALISSEDKVIILRQGTEIGNNLNKIKFTEEAVKMYNVRDNVKYYYWFEIMEKGESSEVLANYNLDLTEEGKKIFSEYNIPSKFPAIIKKTGEYTSYYFGGDFADNGKLPKVYGYSKLYLLNKITAIDIPGNMNYFYFNVYCPIIKKILSTTS